MKEGLRVDSPMCVSVTGEEQPCTQLAEEGLAQKVKQGACAWVEHPCYTKTCCPLHTCVWLSKTKHRIIPEVWILLMQLTILKVLLDDLRQPKTGGCLWIRKG